MGQLIRRRSSQTAPKLVERLVSVSNVVELRLQGHDYETIGPLLGIKPDKAQQLVTDAMNAIAAPLADTLEAVRNLDLKRLDKMMIPFMTSACEGDHHSAAVVLKIMERRAQLLGLDAPKNVNLSGEVGIRLYAGVDTDKV